MITIKNIFEKSALNKANQETLLLLELKGSRKNVKTKRQVLNLSIAIDISGSMDMQINNDHVRRAGLDVATVMGGSSIFGQHLGRGFNPIAATNSYGYTRLAQAKKAAIKAVENMTDKDFVSIVAFDARADVVIQACKTTASNKVAIINAINALRTRGSTDLHNGWLVAATEVAKNANSESLNRVIVLSDGDTNHGIQDPEQIANNVMALYEKSISTTTFGIGDGFNEDLLQAMSNSGGGNSYYISDDNKFDEMFNEEFSGLSNTCGSEVKLTFELNEGFKIKEQLNSLVVNDGVYLLPNVYTQKDLSVMFKMETLIEKGTKVANIGKVKIEYKDEEGKKNEIITELSLKVVGKKAWEALEYNAEVKVQETLMIVANNKIEATRYLSRGDLVGAQGILRGSAAYVNSVGLNDDRLKEEYGSLESTLIASASGMSMGDLRKDIAYQSLNTRTGKDIK